MSRMTLEEFDLLIGQDSYVRCMGKKRLDQAIVAERIDPSTLEYNDYSKMFEDTNNNKHTM